MLSEPIQSQLTEEQRAISIVITTKLISLGLQADFVPPVSVGPIISVYRFQPKGATRVSQIESLSEDIALILGSKDNILVKRMPGETAVGLFIPNKERTKVLWRDILPKFDPTLKIPMLMGIDYMGKVVIADLTTMPHLLVAGSTDSGKSTFSNSVVASIMYARTSKEVRFVISDTKGVEFSHFINSPHLENKPAHSVYETLERIDELLKEMDERFKLFGKGGHRNILEYNSSCETRSDSQNKLPYYVLLIDELADLLGDSSRTSETRGPSIGSIAQEKIGKLAQKARATGIHIIASTQRPSVKVVEGNIKANFPARLCFRVPSQTDSRTVLDTSGAEHLLSRGDALFINPNCPGIQRIHAPEAPLSDIKALIEYTTRR